MECCQLVKPGIKFEPEIRSYRRELIACGSSMDGTGNLKDIEDISDWIAWNQACTSKETLPNRALVPADLFLFIKKSDQRIVGMIQLRHELNDFLQKYSGHIGYSVRPSERKKGYATAMLRACLKICKQRNMQKVMVSCARENIGSKKTILANGGVYEETVYCEKKQSFLEKYRIVL